jgi:alkylhydroperoxidase/carboxymuconolactone decarboxylase family protein YurZ
MRKLFTLLLFITITCATGLSFGQDDPVSNDSTTTNTEQTEPASTTTTVTVAQPVKEETVEVQVETKPVPLTYLKEYDFLGKTIICLVSLMIVAAIVGLIWGNEWLKNALTDNTSEKRTIPNPQYSLLLGAIASNSGTSSGTPAQVQAALATAQASLTALDAARAATPAAPATVAAAQAAHDADLIALSALINPGSASVGVMNGLASLFPPTIEVTTDKNGDDSRTSFRPSASRLLAFFSGLLLMLVGLVCSCFYIYFYLVSGVAPDLSKLTGVFIALGIGMAPYAINKVANATTGKDKTI